MRCKKIVAVGLSVIMVYGLFSYIPATGVKASAAEVFDVLDYGAVPGDSEDDTKAIREAVWQAGQAGGGIVNIPNGDYNVSINEFGHCIDMESNVTLKLGKKAVLNVAGTDREDYYVIQINNKSNVTITGGKINGERKLHKGKSGEFGLGICAVDAVNLTISNMTIANNWGDGIYLGKQTGKGCNKVKISKCKIQNNRRNNIAIVNASNVTIDNCKILKANGVQPCCGINIEPNADSSGKIPKKDICKNITIKNTTVTCKKMGVDNFYFAFQTISHPEDRSMISCQNVKIIKCDFRGDAGNYSGKKVQITNSKIKGTFYDCKKTKVKNTKIGRHYKF